MMERGLIKVLTNLGSAPAEFANPEGLALVLASGSDVRVMGDRVHLPPDRLAVLSHESVGVNGV